MSEDLCKVEVLFNSSKLAEGPHWIEATSELLWVDICGKSVNFFDCVSTQNVSMPVPDVVSAAIPCRGNPDTFIITMERALCLFDRRSGSVKNLLRFEADKEGNRCNDAKCDSKGRLCFGTMGPEPVPGQAIPNRGSFYSYTPSAGIQTHFRDVSISNGIGWSLDQKTMYYVDSTPKNVYSFDYNVDSGILSNNRVFVNFDDIKEDGVPDGMSVDSEGNLWIASFFGACVLKFSPQGKLLNRIKFPARRTTSCCFGGSNYSTLFVTSASVQASSEEMASYPNTGAVFIVKNPGATGLPAWNFDDSALTV